MDYADAPDEVAKNPNMKAWLKTIANGDESAFAFMWSMWNWSHVIDDLVDRDKVPTVEDAAGNFIKIAHALSFNEFYMRFKTFLFPLVVSMFNRWCDGEEWEKSDDKYRQAASHVIKCGDLDLYLTVAYLTGGWEHMRACKDCRAYDLNGLEMAATKE